jgi:hypothetical protein
MAPRFPGSDISGLRRSTGVMFEMALCTRRTIHPAMQQAFPTNVST